MLYFSSLISSLMSLSVEFVSNACIGYIFNLDCAGRLSVVVELSNLGYI
jgi:hypothetical protein